MLCPTDQTTLVMSERNGIEIDYCPDCRGVWLDRGELDKIIERAGVPAAAAPAAQVQQPYPEQQPYPTQGYPQSGGGHHGGNRGQYRKKNNWLGELFD